MLLLRENGVSELVIVGPNIVGGHLVQLFIPGNTFHTARITGKRRWFLGASTEWPDVVPTEDVELGNADELAAKYPEARRRHPRLPRASQEVAGRHIHPKASISDSLAVEQSLVLPSVPLCIAVRLGPACPPSSAI